MTIPQKVSQLDQITTVDVNDLVLVTEVPITTLSSKKMEVGDFLPDLTDGGTTLVRGFGSLEFATGFTLTDLGSRNAQVVVDLATLSITDLGDVPDTFTGAGTFVLRVNPTEDAVEFVDLGGLGLGAGGTQGQVQYNDAGNFGAFGQFVAVDNSLLLNGAASSITPGSVGSGIFSAENSTLDSTRSAIVGGVNHNLLGNTAVATVAGTNNDITSSTDSGIFAGINNTVTGAAGSAAIAGDSNQVLGARSVAIGGANLVAVNPDTVYVPQLNVNQLGAGAAVSALGVDAAGNVVDAATLGIAGGLNFGIQYNNSGALDGWGSVNPAANQWIIANVTDSTIDAASTNAGIIAGFGNTINSASNFSGLAFGRFGDITNSQYAGIFAGQSNRIRNSGDFSVVLGGENNIIGVDTGSTVVQRSGILAGNSNIITKSQDSAIIGGVSNQVDCADRSVVIGGNGLVALADDTVYVPFLNINQVPAGVPVTGLAVDANGNVVQGSIGGGGTGATVIVADDAPTQRPDSSALQNGDLWWSSDTARLFVYYIDTNSSQWVNVNLLAAADGGGTIDPDAFVSQTSPLGSAEMPGGTTLQRDAVPSPGYTRYNSDLDCIEFFSAGSGWVCTSTGTGGGTTPLQGKTYTPNDSSLEIFSFPQTNIGPITADATYISPTALDLTDGGAVTIPTGATHVKLRWRQRANTVSLGYTARVYVEQDAAGLAGIGVNDDTRYRVLLTPMLNNHAGTTFRPYRPQGGFNNNNVVNIAVNGVGNNNTGDNTRAQANITLPAVPAGATHVLMRAYADCNTGRSNDNWWLYVEENAATLAGIATGSPSIGVSKIRLDPKFHTQGTPGNYEDDDMSTFIVPIASSNTVTYRFDETKGDIGYQNSGRLRIWVEGYFLDENENGALQSFAEESATFTVPFDTVSNTVHYREDVALAGTPAGDPYFTLFDVFVDGFYGDDQGTAVVSNPVPLEGKTFNPSTASPLLPTYQEVLTSSNPASAVDLQYLRTINVAPASPPVGATHVQVRLVADAQNEDHVHKWHICAEESPAALTSALAVFEDANKLFLDPALSAPSVAEASETAVFTVPFDTVANTFELGIVETRTTGAGPNNQLTFRVYIEGFYADDTGTSVAFGEAPLLDSIAPDFLANSNWVVNSALNIANPANASTGQSGHIRFLATPASWDTNFRFPGGVTPGPVVGGAIMKYYVVSPTEIWMHNFENNIS